MGLHSVRFMGFPAAGYKYKACMISPVPPPPSLPPPPSQYSIKKTLSDYAYFFLPLPAFIPPSNPGLDVFLFFPPPPGAPFFPPAPCFPAFFFSAFFFPPCFSALFWSFRA